MDFPQQTPVINNDAKVKWNLGAKEDNADKSLLQHREDYDL